MAYEWFEPVEGGKPVAFRYDSDSRYWVAKEGGLRVLKETFKEEWQPCPAPRKPAAKKAAVKKAPAKKAAAKK